MNNSWKKFIHQTLGSFWDRVFKDSSIISGVCKAHYSKMLDLYSYTQSLKDSLRIDTEDKIIPVMSSVDIPVSECLINSVSIADAGWGGSVAKTSPIPSVTVPKKYIADAISVHSSMDSDGVVWVSGINMTVVGDSIILYGDTKKIHTDMVQGPSGELMKVLRLYPVNNGYTTHYNDNFGCVCGNDLDALTSEDRTTVWDMFINGPTEAKINTLIAHSCGNDVCEEDDTVADVWHEGANHYIRTMGGRLYAGTSLPRVCPGSAVKIGDFLFVGTYVWNDQKLPPADKVPYLLIKSPYGDLIAENKEKQSIITSDGYIPDMGNSTWTQYAMNSGLILSDKSYENPAHYVLSRLYRSNSIVYTVDADDVRSPYLLQTAGAYISNTLLSSGVSGINITRYTQASGFTASAGEPSVTMFTSTGGNSITASAGEAYARYTDDRLNKIIR